MTSITPNLWFDTQALDAAEFYASVFPNSSIDSVSHYPDDGSPRAGTVLTVDFTLDGNRFLALNGGPQFTFSEAVSFVISCEDQATVDHYWDRLTDGGEESMCGWLKDRYGVSWQVVPTGFVDLLNEGGERAQRAATAMMSMRKLDLAALLAAADA